MDHFLSKSGCFAVIGLLLISGCKTLELKPNSVASFSNEEKTAEIESTFSKSELLISSARKFERAGQIEEAIKLYEKVVKSGANREKSHEANRHLAILYDLSDQTAKARNAFKLAMEHDNPEVDLLNDYGYFLMKNQDYSEALEILSSAHSQSPENERVATNLGMALVSSGRVEEGYKLFASVVESPEAASNVGAVLLQLGETQAAEKWLQQAVDSNHDGGISIARNMLKMANQK